MTTTQAGTDLAEFAALTVRHLRAPGPLDADDQVTGLAEAAAEFLCAHRRRDGGLEDVAAGLAGIVIAAYVAAEVLGVDLEMAWRARAHQVLTGGWDERKAPAR